MQGFETLRVTQDGAVAEVVIDHPPINLMDAAMSADLGQLQRHFDEAASIKVAVFRSANPEFFIAHADLTTIERLRAAPPTPATQEGLLGFHRFIERWRKHRVITIAEIAGCVRGGGSELALSFDMRFAALGRAVFGQPEVALGIIPGGGGTQRLPRLMGRGRALEVVLGCDDFDAATAERYGWVNRALPAEELSPFVDRLAQRLAAMPVHALVAAKQAVLAAESDHEAGLHEEARFFFDALAHDETGRRLDRAHALDVQTRDYELRLGDTMVDPRFVNG